MPQIEQLSGGLVTSRDASLLEPGELQLAENILLKPGDPSVHKAPGRERLNSNNIASGAGGLAGINGLGYAAFAQKGNRIIAVTTDGKYYQAPETDNALTLLSTGAGTTLDVVMMNDRAILLSGGTNKVMLPDGTIRAHGLLPVTASPGTTLTGSGGTFPVPTGIYEYWTTEVYKSGTEEVEGTFAGVPSTVTVATATSHVTITRPGTTNPTATHWRIYRSIPKSVAENVAFPNGFFIGEALISTVSFEDGVQTTTADQLAANTAAGTFNNHANRKAAFLPSAYTTWANPDNVLADDAAVATATVDTTTTPVAELWLGGFPFTGGGTPIGDPITSINVIVEGKRSGSGLSLEVQLSGDGGVSWTSSKTVALTTSLAVAPTLTGLWGQNWNSAQLTANLFKVALVAIGTGSIDVDVVKVNVTHSGTTGAQVTVFPSVQIVAGPSRLQIGSQGAPPSATTGDVFQGSLVMNDPANPTSIAWTLPGFLDYVPANYRMSFDSMEPVRGIRAVGGTLVVGLAGSVHRLNYLPVAEDPEFNTARAEEEIDADDGWVTLHAACKFLYEGRPMLFYVGHSALKMTDAYNVTTATDDIIWTDVVGNAPLTDCHVRNNAKHHEIQVFFSGKRLRLSYDSSHLKNGKLKVVSLDSYSTTASVTGVSDTGEKVFYTGRSDGFIYTENRGYVDASGGTIVPRIKTREIYAERGTTWELLSLGVHHRNNPGSQVSVTYSTAFANNPEETATQQAFEAADRTQHIINGGVSGDGISITLSAPNDGLPLDIDYLVLYAGSLGDTIPLKT